MKPFMVAGLLLTIFIPSVAAADLSAGNQETAAVEAQVAQRGEEEPAVPAAAAAKKEIREERFEGTVTRVLSADTVEIDGMRVHLMGVSSPQMWWWGEPKDCLAALAAKFVEDAILDQAVSYSYDSRYRWRDRRGKEPVYRVYLYKDDRSINAELISSGYAFADRSKQYREKENFLALEAQAYLHFLGFWHTCPVECYRSNTVCRVRDW